MQHSLDNLLRLAWVEGCLNTRGAYEKAILSRQVDDIPARTRDTLVARLEVALTEERHAVPLTVGVLLRGLRSERHLRPDELFVRLGVSGNIFRLMEHDAISPLKIPVEVWKRLCHLLNISAGDLADMIRRTHRLVFFRPSIGGVLARYTPAKKGKKASVLEHAFLEMYAKAELPVPGVEHRKVEDLIHALGEWKPCKGRGTGTR